jgi:hypothetical protein
VRVIEFGSGIGQRFEDRPKFVAREASLTIREEEMAVAYEATSILYS